MADAKVKVPFDKKIRPFLIAFIVLPISVLLSVRGWFGKTCCRKQRNPELHDVRVERVMKQIQEWTKDGKPVAIRTDRQAAESHNVRIVDKSKSKKLKLRDFNCILGLDRDRSVIRVEPGVTVGEVTTFLVKRNLQLEGKGVLRASSTLQNELIIT